MSDREIVYAVRYTDGISGAVYQSRAEAESDVEAAASFGIDAAAVELVEVVRCRDCRHNAAGIACEKLYKYARCGGDCFGPDEADLPDEDWFCADGESR